MTKEDDDALKPKALDKATPTQDAISKLPVFLAGAGLGLLAAYMLDPQHGQSRRAKLKHQSDHGWRHVLRRIASALHDFTHRSAPKAKDTAREALVKAKKSVEDTVSH